MVQIEDAHIRKPVPTSETIAPTANRAANRISAKASSLQKRELSDLQMLL